MDPATAAALISAGSQTTSGIFGFLGQRRQNKHNLQLAKDARNHDVNMWNMQNQYNTPAMQMQRYKEAGLNPNLMYGQGTSGNATAPPKAPVPEVGNELAAISQMSALPMLSMYQDWRVKNAQIDNIKAQTNATQQNASLTALRQITQDYTNKKLYEEMPFWYDNAKSSSYKLQGQSEEQKFRAKTSQMLFHNQLPAQIQNMILRNSLLETQIRGNTLENDLNEDLKPFGGSTRDNLLQRMLIKFAAPQMKALDNEFRNPSFLKRNRK